MRPFGFAGFFLLLAGCATAHGEHGPAGVPYACAEGGDARVVYGAGGGSALSRATVRHAGQVHALTAVPAEYGLRYVSSAEGASIVTWSVNGETASLSTIARDAPADAIAHLINCPRRRDGHGEAADPHADEAPDHH